MQKYVFRIYDAKYLAFFRSEKKKITKALGSPTKIEHIGSTAIPWLGGKGIIDIIIGTSKSKINEVKRKLEEAGYEFREQAGTPERLFFRRDYTYKNTTRRVHIHLTKFNGNEWNAVIGFRDYLLHHPNIVEKYSSIKKEWIKKALGDWEKYRKYKEKFIENILRKIVQ
jgi:GrpB-like predicted nucleotidyltransferase (UPF0157 family)